jgi:hypothetical protein
MPYLILPSLSLPPLLTLSILYFFILCFILSFTVLVFRCILLAGPQLGRHPDFSSSIQLAPAQRRRHSAHPSAHQNRLL